jgi:hypothetical protein
MIWSEQKEAGVDRSEIERRMLSAYGVRVEPAMSEYIARRLAAAGAALRELPVIGGDARTGLPTRVVVDPSRLTAPAVP